VDLFPIWLSLRVAVLATCLTLLLGVPLAWFLARTRFRGRELLEGLVVLPLAIYDRVQAFQMEEANLLSAIAVGIMLVLVLGVGRLARVRY
jgi:ABC-type molybdate transport system permease subunit